MASDEVADEVAIRRIARAVVAEMQNSGIGLTPDEARQVLLAENSDATEFECASCHAAIADPTAKRCPKCGSGSMIVASDAAYRCERCGHPIRDRSIPSCPSCGHDKVVAASGAKSNPGSYYTCTDCLEPVAVSQPRCTSCGGTRCYRTVER